MEGGRPDSRVLGHGVAAAQLQRLRRDGGDVGGDEAGEKVEHLGVHHGVGGALQHSGGHAEDLLSQGCNCVSVNIYIVT